MRGARRRLAHVKDKFNDPVAVGIFVGLIIATIGILVPLPS